MTGELTIRSVQMNALRESSRGALAETLREALRTHWPRLAERLGGESAGYFAEQAIERCVFYEIHERRDHFRYLNVMALLGPDFDEQEEWAREILEQRQLCGSARLDRLVDRIRARIDGGDL